MAKDDSQAIFPYVPFQTFESFIKHLHETVVTDQIDNSMMPNNFSGSSCAWVTSALKSLKLIDAKNNTTPKLKELVDAYQSENWASKIKEHVLSIYTNIPENIDLKSVTQKQLEDMFPDMSPQMRDKSIRFYLAANKEAGIEYSPLMKQRRKSTKRKRIVNLSTKRKNSNEQPPKPPNETPKDKITPPGMLDLPIIGVPESFIRVPENITMSDIALINGAVAYLKIKAEQNTESE